MPRLTPSTIALLALPSLCLAGPRAGSPRETAAAVLFARDEGALEPYLLASTREQLRLLDADLRSALLDGVRPLGLLEKLEGVKVQRVQGETLLARVTIEGEVLEVTLGPVDPSRREEDRGAPQEEGVVVLEMGVSEPAAVAHILPMMMSLRQEDGAWRLVRADYGVNPFHLDALALVYWLDDPQLASRVHGAVATANVRAVIGDLRTFVTGQVTYASANGGAYDSPACLVKPVDCIPGYPTAGPTFLSAELGSLQVKAGYKRTFVPGPALPEAEKLLAQGFSASSLTSFAYLAVPLKPGVTGTASFCTDATGRICVLEDGTTPRVVDGSCDPCQPMR